MAEAVVGQGSALENKPEPSTSLPSVQKRPITHQNTMLSQASTLKPIAGTDENMGKKAQAQAYFGLCHFEQKIKQPDPQHQHDNFNGKGCPVCLAQISIGDQFQKKQEVKTHLYESGQKLKFEELIRKLIPDQNNPKERMIKGCQIIMPETIFFKDAGKIDLIVQCDREWCLSQDTKTKNPTLLEMRKKLPSIVEERRRDTAYLGVTKAATRPQENKKPTVGKSDFIKEDKQAKSMPFVILRFIDRDSQAGEPGVNSDMSEELKVPAHQVIAQSPFLAYYCAKSHSYNFNKVQFMQTCIRTTNHGIGKPVHYDFFAPLNDRSPKAAAQEIDYNFKHMADEVTLLERNDLQEFAKRQCLKICYYLQKVRQIEVLQMKAEFLQDDNGNVWFTYAHNIQYREMKDKLGFAKVDTEKKAMSLQQHQQQKKDMLLKELQEYEASLQETQGGQPGKGQTSAKDLQARNKMLDFMNNFYMKMKDDMGFNANYGVEQDDAELDAVLRQLRPNTTAKNFREFLSRGQNVYKNQNWRAIAREVQHSDEKKRRKSENNMLGGNMVNHLNQGDFFSARNTQRTEGQVDALISAMDKKQNQNVRYSVDKSRQMNQQQSNTMVEVHSSPSQAYQAPQQNPVMMEGNKNVSLLKAELVRNNMVTRTDLMKLYQPPVKKSQMIANNPFFSKSFVASPENQVQPPMIMDRNITGANKVSAKQEQQSVDLWMSNRMAQKKAADQANVRRSQNIKRNAKTAGAVGMSQGRPLKDLAVM